MEYIEKLVTPVEALALFDKSNCLTMIYGTEVAKAYADAEAQKERHADATDLFGCVWQAGRVQGIREERKRRKEADISQAMRQQPVGRTALPDGRTIPVYTMGGYLETPEGWKLYCGYCDARHAFRQAEEAYKIGRRAYEADRAAKEAGV